MPGLLGDLLPGGLHTLVEDSQQRCVAQHKLVSRSTRPVMRMQETAIVERRERFLDLVGGGPELDKSSILPDKSRYCLLISDGDGVVVESYLPDTDAQEFDRCGLAMGGLWTEASAGTNGIDMAMQVGRVVTVQGADHYFSCFHDFACSSAPLRDAQANLIGTLTLVGSARRKAEEISWCEQVLRITGTRFQARLFRKFHLDKMTARLISRSPDRMHRFETIVACDEEGTILSSLPLWRDGPTPETHRKLEGRHLSELQGVSVTLRGPTLVPPRRLVSIGAVPERARALHSRPGRVLATLAEQGGSLPALIDRARKLAAHYVPLLVCGEAGVGQDGFVRALQDDLGLNSTLTRIIDGTRPFLPHEFTGMLEGLRFLCEYPVEHCPPSLVLHHVERMHSELQAELAGFLRRFDDEGGWPVQVARRPHLFFTSERSWQDMSADNGLDPLLLHLVGQAIVELPPLRERDLEKALAQLLSEPSGSRLTLSDQAKAELLSYGWPGNLREMRSVLREAAICGNGTRINLVDLPERVRRTVSPDRNAAGHDALREALDSTGWNISRAARILGKSRATVNRWIASEGLERPASG